MVPRRVLFFVFPCALLVVAAFAFPVHAKKHQVELDKPQVVCEPVGIWRTLQCQHKEPEPRKKLIFKQPIRNAPPFIFPERREQPPAAQAEPAAENSVADNENCRIQRVVISGGIAQNGNGIPYGRDEEPEGRGDGTYVKLHGSCGIFGAEKGHVFVNDHEVIIVRRSSPNDIRVLEDQWFPDLIEFQLAPLYPEGIVPQEHNAINLISGPVHVVTVDDRELQGPYLYLESGDNNIHQQYDAYIEDYAEEAGFGEQWVNWMQDDRCGHNPHRQPNPCQGTPAGVRQASRTRGTFSNRYRYLQAFQRSRLYDKHIRIAWHLAPRAELCGEPWPGETEAEQIENNMLALKNYMELAYPGYTFTFNYNGVRAENDLIIFAHGIEHLNHYSDAQAPAEHPRYELGENYLYLRNYGIMLHEFAHFFNLNHHYYDEVDPGGANSQQFLPPQGSRSCYLDNHAGNLGLCSACAAALRIEPEQFTPERIAQIEAALEELRAHEHEDCQL